MSIYSIQATFGRGELTPKIHSRTDIEHFSMGLALCENFMVMRQGGLRRRPGTQFIAEVKDSARPVRLIPFIFSASQAYVLEMGDRYLRVYANGGRVGTIEVATPWVTSDLFQLDYDQTNDVLDVTHKDYRPHRIMRFSHTDWRIAPVPLNDGPYLPINGSTTRLAPNSTGNAIPTPGGSTIDSGASIRIAPALWAFTSVTGWMGYAFPSPRVIVAYAVKAGTTIDRNNPGNSGPLNAPKSWTFEAWDGATWTTLDSQYGQSAWSPGESRTFIFNNTQAYSQYRLNVSGNNGGIYLEVFNLAMTESPDLAPPTVITALGTDGINNGAGFVAGDVGRFISLLGSDTQFHPFRISGVISPTQVYAKATGAPLLDIKLSTQWRLGAWSTTTGWPAHVATFEGRKVYARTNHQPSGVWMTRSGGYGAVLDFSTSIPIADDDAIGFTLTDVNEIQWIAEGQDLLIGTAGAARTMGRDSPNMPFSARNFRQSLASTYAAQAIRPARAGTSTIFVSRFGKAFREFIQAEGGYDTPDISIISEHMLASGVVELAYAQEPDSVVWAANGKGELVGLTYEKAQAMAGMHRHILGGGGVVESCCTIPGVDHSELWMIVRRTIGGVTKRTIERMAAPFEATSGTLARAWYVDSGLSCSGPPVTQVSGLDHLEGQRVAILADGARETDQIVKNGSVTLASGKAASTIIVGLPYRSRARTLPSPVSVGDGSGLGRRKKVVSARIDLLETGSLKVGRDAADAGEIDLRSTGDSLGAAPPLATGFYDARFASRWQDGGQIEMIADGPLPATIRSLTLSLEPEP